MPDKPKFEIIIIGSIMAVLASFVSTLVKKEINRWDQVRTFLAGTCAGILFQLLFLDFNFAQGWKNILSSTAAAYVTSVWPAIEVFLLRIIGVLSDIAAKYLKRKGDDIIQKP